MVYTLYFFPLQNAICFKILTYLVAVFTFYIRGVLKLKTNSGARRLTVCLAVGQFSPKYFFVFKCGHYSIPKLAT